MISMYIHTCTQLHYICIGFVKTDVEKLLKPKRWGWRFVAFDLRFPNGQLVEYYLPPLELDEKPIKVCICTCMYVQVHVCLCMFMHIYI
jgi:hypothetical protein